MEPRVMELRIKKWIPLIEEQAKSGMTKNEWCATHGIERTTFFRWQKRVRAYLIDQCETQSSQFPSSIPSNNEVRFVELPSVQDSPVGMSGRQCGGTVQPCGAPPSISIRYGDFSIDLNRVVDEKQLSMVLMAGMPVSKVHARTSA